MSYCTLGSPGFAYLGASISTATSSLTSVSMITPDGSPPCGAISCLLRLRPCRWFSRTHRPTFTSRRARTSASGPLSIPPLRLRGYYIRWHGADNLSAVLTL